MDSSDNEEHERQVQKRRHYTRLLQRRQNKKRLNDQNEDVEDMLFEQVEREREDKLCVICQDNEKCIMILPCRHLCICQDCQEPLRRRGNNMCPICRRNVRQTIKAYLWPKMGEKAMYKKYKYMCKYGENDVICLCDSYAKRIYLNNL